MNPPRLPVLGHHLLLDLQGVSPEILSDTTQIEHILFSTAEAATIDARLQHFGAGQSVTGVLLLKESHISIHTWPEYRFAAVGHIHVRRNTPASRCPAIHEAFPLCVADLRNETRGAVDNGARSCL